MNSTKRATIRTLASKYLAVTTFTVGLAIRTAAVATAEWDIEAYDYCISTIKQNPGRTVRDCCNVSGGVWDEGHFGCQAPPVNDAMTGQPVPPRSPEEIVGGPVRDFNVSDANVPDAPVIVLPAP